VNPLLDLDARPVIAHRGASGHAPENTLAAFELAAREGADAFELDVRLSLDGAPVVIHDHSLDRTTDGTGPVRARTLADLRSVDAGARFTHDRGRTYPYRGAGLTIPTLGEVLWTFPKMPMLVEVKEPEAQEAVRRVLVEEDAIDRCVPASDLGAALEVFREGPFARAASAKEVSDLYWAVMWRRQISGVGYRTLSVPMRYRGIPVPTRTFVARARTLGCPVHVWTVNRAATARRLWARGVAGMVTNLPALMRQAAS
jgi:glycerophosphoryl diester phosphodiesterase